MSVLDSRGANSWSSDKGNGMGTMFFQARIHDYNQNVTINLPKKVRHPSLRRFLLSVKGRRKEKDAPLPAQEEYRLYLEEDYVKEKITDTDLHILVTQPSGHDYNEWLATHTISFFEHVNLMYGTVSEFCTSTVCSSMTGPGNTQYLWLDEKGKKCKCAAPQYVDYVMSFTQKTIHDESVFPTKYGNVFPSSMEVVVKKIHRYLFHVIAHIYQSHFKEILLLQLHGHLNTLFQHFMTFNREFNLLDDKELDGLDDLYEKLEDASLVMMASSPLDALIAAATDSNAPGDEVTTDDAKEENKENVENQESTTTKSEENHQEKLQDTNTTTTMTTEEELNSSS